MRADVRTWLSEMYDHFRNHPKRAPLYIGFTLYLSIWYAITSRWPFGKNVYESEWDLLIILDACRVDTLREVADEYSFIEDVESVWSVGSQSSEWMANTFTTEWEQEIGKTTYISGNGYSDAVLSRRHHPPANNTTPIDLSSWSTVDEFSFQSYISVWEHNHDQRYGSVLPRAMTDQTIRAGRMDRTDRIIAHYTQPHLPYIGDAFREGRDPTEVERRGYELLEEGSAERDAVYEAYKNTLRWVLNDVELLLENIDAEDVVITADHGEAFGEWFAYGHPEGFLHPTIRKAPWVDTTARDEGTRQPEIDSELGPKTEVEEHLRDLGYR